MNDDKTYIIELEGHFSHDELNAGSPIEMVISQTGVTTRCVVHTDQSGLIGLLRHLHARGLCLLSVVSAQETNKEGKENDR